MSFSPLINHLILALRCLPGIGPKSAQRMAFHLLERHRDKGIALAEVLTQAMKSVRHCEQCRTFCEEAICALCQNKGRDHSLLCIVETPADILAIEQTGTYRGLYFVLMGHLSPIDAIGPEEIGVDLFINRLEVGEIREVILATNPTVEGEATAYYFAELARAKGISATRIALGVPMGGELEYLDSNTLARALSARSLLTEK